MRSGWRSDPEKQDEKLSTEVRRIFGENFGVYGVRKVWRQMKREGLEITRCTMWRLPKAMGLKGAVRGKVVKTTKSDKAAPAPLDHVNRNFKAPSPNALWVSDFTFVATWRGRAACFASPSATAMTMRSPRL
ncbi:HTH-like domain-containing protein [Fulvimarina manganoxydans]|uniref:HTH-like domain-containing protein n=1 Tax=Fulvimarina manganoxydans TaxID=937218 RepID=A0A1W2DJ24_9HYPH|nr:HTH-like domain-containing protein [Fulvimarina manganoxydans]